MHGSPLARYGLIWATGIALTLALPLALPFPAQAQPACPPGEHFVPGRGCLPNRPPRPLPPPPAPAPGPQVWAVPPAVVPPAGLPAVVAGGPAKVRACPGQRCAVLGELRPGAHVVYLRHQHGFGYVEAPQRGLKGWVRLRHLASAP